jgi:hypothetical protein
VTNKFPSTPPWLRVKIDETTAHGRLAMTRQQGIFWWVVASGGLMLIGAFGPWVKAFAVSASGTDGSNDGWIVVGAAAVGAGVFWLKGETKLAGVWPLLGGAAGTLTTIYDRGKVQDAIDEGGALTQAVVQIGWGLNLAMIASISLAMAGIAWIAKYGEFTERVVLQPKPGE